MFEDLPLPETADIELARAARPALHSFLIVTFVIQTIAFILLLYLLRKRTPRQMAEYARLLRMNLISAYFTQTVFVLWLPTALPTNYHVLSDGPIGWLSPTANMVWIFILVASICVHCISIILSMGYQLTLIIAVRKQHRIRSLMEKILADNVLFSVLFTLNAVAVVAVVVFMFRAIPFDTQPISRLDLSIPMDLFLYTEYLRDSPNAVFADFSGSHVFLFFFTGFSICMIALTLFGVRVCFQRPRFAVTSKTRQLQRSLRVSIVAQAVSLTVFYVIPLEVLLAAGTLRLPYAFTLMFVAMGSMATYAPVNHLVMLGFIRHYRLETVALIKSLYGEKSQHRKVVVHARSEMTTTGVY